MMNELSLTACVVVMSGLAHVEVFGNLLSLLLSALDKW